MAKKQTFLDKTKKKDKSEEEFVKVVKAVRADNGAWKFKAQVVKVTPENRDEIFNPK